MSTIDRNRTPSPLGTTARPAETAKPAANTVKTAAPAPAAAKTAAPSSAFVSSTNAMQALSGVGKPKEKDLDGMLVGANGSTFPPGTPLAQIPGVTPKNNPNPDKTLIYVNGIMTNLAGQSSDLQAIADKSGAKTIGIHNSTNGFISDLAQCVKDKLDKGKNPAVDTLADTVYSELKAGRQVSLMGYSQGGLITARALFDVQNRLRIEDGMSKADVEKTMGRINVETFGAASTRYPDGPKYVHYVNNRDAVPVVTGLGGKFDPLSFLKDAGKDAVVHRFSEGGLNLLKNHSLQETYLNHRVPFEQARQNQF